MGALRDSAEYKQKMRSNDRVFVLAAIEGKFTLTTAGTTDVRLYTKGNQLHARQMDNGLWFLYLECGALPPPLKQMFTNFNLCEKTVREYYLRRNIEVKEIKD